MALGLKASKCYSAKFGSSVVNNNSYSVEIRLISRLQVSSSEIPQPSHFGITLSAVSLPLLIDLPFRCTARHRWILRIRLDLHRGREVANLRGKLRDLLVCLGLLL